MADGGLLLVHAHPDDEVFATGGTMARAVAEGRRVDLVVCTDGAEGEIHDPDLDPAEATARLGEIRMAELACSLAALGGGSIGLHGLGFRDSGMMGTPPNADPRAFWQASVEAAGARVADIIREVRPAAVITYNDFGGYGHPDHIQAHRVAAAGWSASGTDARWYEITFSRQRWGEGFAAMKARGISLPWGGDDESDEASDEPNPFEDAPITSRVDVTPWLATKHAAMVCHRTQRQDFGWAIDLPDDLWTLIGGQESFVRRVEPAGEVVAGPDETWFFD
jgi:N-acetyl-1-D-myo-inositol-2-amino-2-deoxy-alpha-D-glucopyranoside deacetylase